ncbi:MAG: pyridoxamine 5'-phosphate oxidase family protein [bacterium]
MEQENRAHPGPVSSRHMEMRIPESLKSMLGADRVILVASADRAGRVHLAAARGLLLLDEEHLATENWFCRRTIGNLEENPTVAVAVLAQEEGRGFELTARVEQVLPLATLDGYPAEEARHPGRYPQSKSQLRFCVETVRELTTGPHLDD